MKMRKLLALSMALALTLCPMQVAAADAVTTPGPGTGETLEGDVNYVNTTVYKVTLPTTAGLTFALDPQGLSTLDNSGTYDGSKAGKIVGTGTMTAINESSVDIELTAEFYLTDTDTSTLTLLAKEDIANIDNDAKEMCLTIQQSDQDASNPTFTDYAAITSTSSSAPTKVTLSMTAADYTFAAKSGGGYEYIVDTSGITSTKEVLQFGGVVAKNYDWSAYTDGGKTLTLNAVFGFSDPNAAAADDYVMALQSDGSVAYTFADAPTGTLTGLVIDEQSRAGFITNGFATYTAGMFAITKEKAELAMATSGTHTLVLTFDDGTSKTLTYTN